MTVRLVCTDLDGTFLGASGLAHPGNMAAARELTEAGIHLVIATGRPRRWLDVLDPLMDINPHVVASNGGSVGHLATLEPDRIHPLPADAVARFLAAMPEEVEPAYAFEYALAWGREDHYPAGTIRIEGGLIAPRDALLAEGPVIKMLVHSRRANTERLAALCREAAGDELTVTFSWSAVHGTVEISAPGVSKGMALQEIADSLGVDVADCAGFGDMPNDLEMLKLVGHPFVMADSHPSMFGHGFTRIGHHDEGAVGEQMRAFLR